MEGTQNAKPPTIRARIPDSGAQVLMQARHVKGMIFGEL
jgi:hypothetical protein